MKSIDRWGWPCLLLTLGMVLLGCQPKSDTPQTGASEKAATPSAPVQDAEPAETSPGGDNVAPTQDDAGEPAADSQDDPTALRAPESPPLEIPATWKRLGQEEEIWIDTQNKQVIIGGKVCLSEGPLEMFICPEGTKEHESIVSAKALASQVHAALIALGADPGQPASWQPEYRAAYGPSIEVEMWWMDAAGELKKASARDWIRNVNTGKAMEAQWVFGGSQIYEDPDTGQRHYLGDGGELICLSNFSTATIDLNVKSSQDNYDLLYEAYKGNVPPVGTQVYAVITPGPIIGKPAPPALEGPVEAESSAEGAEPPAGGSETPVESGGDDQARRDSSPARTRS